jgi:hypothetical protein
MGPNVGGDLQNGFGKGVCFLMWERNIQAKKKVQPLSHTSTTLVAKQWKKQFCGKRRKENIALAMWGKRAEVKTTNKSKKKKQQQEVVGVVQHKMETKKITKPKKKKSESQHNSLFSVANKFVFLTSPKLQKKTKLFFCLLFSIFFPFLFFRFFLLQIIIKNHTKFFSFPDSNSYGLCLFLH